MNLEKTTSATSYSTDSAKKLKSGRRKSALGIILVLLVLAVAGVFVVQNRNKANSFTACLTSDGSKSVASNTGTVCTTKDGKKFTSKQTKAEEWEYYQKDTLSFYHPPDWSITAGKAPPVFGKDSSLFRISGSNDASLSLVPESTTGTSILISTLTLNPSTKINIDCRCTVLATRSFVFRAADKRAQLIAVDLNGNNQADLLIVAPDSVKVGDTKINRFFDLSQKYQIAVQSYVVDKSSITSQDGKYEAKDAQSFLSSTSPSRLIALLSGLTLK